MDPESILAVRLNTWFECRICNVIRGSARRQVVPTEWGRLDEVAFLMLHMSQHAMYSCHWNTQCCLLYECL